MSDEADNSEDDLDIGPTVRADASEVPKSSSQLDPLSQSQFQTEPETLSGAASSSGVTGEDLDGSRFYRPGRVVSPQFNGVSRSQRQLAERHLECKRIADQIPPSIQSNEKRFISSKGLTR